MGLDATFWVTALQLLVSLYQLRRDSGRDKIQLLINLQQEIRTSPPEDPKAFIQERLEAALPQEEAAAVQADLSTIDLLGNAPIETSAFDYWSVLDQLMSSVREFCHRHNVFRFRGVGKIVGSRFLELPKTASALFDAKTRSQWVRIRYPGSSEVRGTAD